MIGIVAVLIVFTVVFCAAAIICRKNIKHTIFVIFLMVSAGCAMFSILIGLIFMPNQYDKSKVAYDKYEYVKYMYNLSIQSPPTSPQGLQLYLYGEVISINKEIERAKRLHDTQFNDLTYPDLANKDLIK